MPQTPTAAWRRSLSEDLTGSETFSELHGSLVHTLGNLTLTGYNSTMSNKPFDVKRGQLHKSGLAMNQEIAREPRWGRAEIHARADQLAKQIAKTWPGPVDAGPEETGAAWDIMAKALQESLPGHGQPTVTWPPSLAAIRCPSECGWPTIRYPTRIASCRLRRTFPIVPVA